jgi:hypothetical protein
VKGWALVLHQVTKSVLKKQGRIVFVLSFLQPKNIGCLGSGVSPVLKDPKNGCFGCFLLDAFEPGASESFEGDDLVAGFGDVELGGGAVDAGVEGLVAVHAVDAGFVAGERARRCPGAGGVGGFPDGG